MTASLSAVMFPDAFKRTSLILGNRVAQHAARHHQEAAKHHESGNHEKAVHHAHTAHAHTTHAEDHADQAAKAHASEHGNK